MVCQAPNAFYGTLSEQMKLPLLDVLRFAEALEGLK